MLGQDFTDTVAPAQATHQGSQDIPLSCDEIAAQIENDDRFCLVNPFFTAQKFAEYWHGNIAVSPQKFMETLSQDLPDGDLKISLRHCGKYGFTLIGSLYEVTDPEANFDTKMRGAMLVEKERAFDFSAQTVRPGFIQAKGMKGGRTLLRNQYELGYDLGCNNVETNSVNVGSWLWTRGFNVVEVNPKYMEYLHAQYAQIAGHISDQDVKARVEAALAEEDMTALSKIDYDVMPDIRDARSMALTEKFFGCEDSEGRVNLSKHLMIVHNDWNWKGHADLDNPRDCYRLGACLGGWSHPTLKERAESYAATASTQTPKPQKLVI